jgi:hypothetical protein
MPSAFAVLRLTIISTFVAYCTGISAGFSHCSKSDRIPSKSARAFHAIGRCRHSVFIYVAWQELHAARSCPINSLNSLPCLARLASKASFEAARAR